MKPVDQTTFGNPGGNCFSACVATLLELPIEDVPYFMGDSLEGFEGATWWERFCAWLAPRNFWALCLTLDGEWRPRGAHILSGKSPRHARGLHSVVAVGDEVVHDPHPSRAGILSNDDVVILVPMDPARGAP